MLEKIIPNSITPYPFWTYLITKEDVDNFLYLRAQEGYRVEPVLYDNLKLALPTWVGRVSIDLLGISMELITKERLASDIKVLLERIGR